MFRPLCISRRSLLIAGAASAAGLGGCKKKSPGALRLQLNWLPEPEFGGFYEAKRLGLLEGVELMPGSPGVPTAQLIASGRVDYGVVCADEVVRLVAQSAPIVAIFASFQISPRGIVVHQSSPFTDLQSLWGSDSTVGIEPGQGYVRWLDHRYSGAKLTRVPRPASLATFIGDKKFAQGIYIFAEGAQLKAQGIPSRIFKVSDSGYNPYEVVLATQPKRLKERPQEVRRIVTQLAKGWGSYLDDPGPANQIMAKQNLSMDLSTMQHSAQLLQELVRVPGTALGSMQASRWEQLIDQMKRTQGLSGSAAAADCFSSLSVASL